MKPQRKSTDREIRICVLVFVCAIILERELLQPVKRQETQKRRSQYDAEGKQERAYVEKTGGEGCKVRALKFQCTYR